MLKRARCQPHLIAACIERAKMLLDKDPKCRVTPACEIAAKQLWTEQGWPGNPYTGTTIATWWERKNPTGLPFPESRLRTAATREEKRLSAASVEDKLQRRVDQLERTLNMVRQPLIESICQSLQTMELKDLQAVAGLVEEISEGGAS